MIERPERHVADFVKAGADNVTFHVEATPHVDYTMNLIREAGATAGVALNPGTAVEALAVEPDLALCMTVNPGWGGQPFIEGSIERIRALRASGRELRSRSTAASTRRPPGRAPQAGATTFVAGSAIFGRPTPAQAYREIAEAAGGSGQPHRGGAATIARH